MKLLLRISLLIQLIQCSCAPNATLLQSNINSDKIQQTLFFNRTTVATPTTGAITNDRGYRIREMFPSYGPYHGGTEVTITLDDMTPSRIDQVFVEFHLPGVNQTFNATVSTQTITDNTIRATTPQLRPSQNESKALVTVSILTNGTLKRSHEYDSFVFKPNPIVEPSIHPDYSILAGGISLTVTGSHFDSVAQPQIVLTSYEKVMNRMTTHQEPCLLKSSSVLICKTPALVLPPTYEGMSRINSENMEGGLDFSGNLLYSFSIQMDGLNRKFQPMNMFPDPEVSNFEPETTEFVANENNNIFIEGVWPKVEFQNVVDMAVYVGTSLCLDLRKVNESFYSCAPPPMPPHVIRYGLSDITVPSVVVRVGNFEQTIGLLKYKANEPIHVIIIATSAILLSIFLIALFFGCAAALDCNRPKLCACRRAEDGRKLSYNIVTEDDVDSNRNRKQRKRRSNEVGGNTNDLECVAIECRSSMEGLSRPPKTGQTL